MFILTITTAFRMMKIKKVSPEKFFYRKWKYFLSEGDTSTIEKLYLY